MTDIALPYDLCPSKITWRLEDNVGVAESPSSRVAQRQARSGARWRATLSWADMSDGDKCAALASLFDLVKKSDNVALLEAFQNDARGTESATATFADVNGPWAVNQLSGWNSQNLVQPAFVDSSGFAVGYGGGTSPALIKRGFVTVVNRAYLVVIDIPPWIGSATVSLEDSGGVFSTTTTTGRVIVPFFARQTVTQINLYCRQSGQTFSKGVFGDVKLYRRYSVQSAVAVGNVALNILGGDLSVPNKNFRAGQFIGVQTSAGVELKRLLRDVHMLGGGTQNGVAVTHLGNALFEPALRGAVAVDAPIFHLQPWCRMRLATPESVADIGPPLLHGFSADFVEEL